MTAPGTRQKVARIIAEHIDSLLRPTPITPMPSPCEPGFLSRRQAT